MAPIARRGAMLPEPKETPPLVHRLRLELNRTVRRRVTEAVDAVCVAFEDDLTRSTVVGVANYEFFYDCCSRLAQFIDANMETTPGFLQQMDRLIFACHSGASGPLLHSAMTKDLRIRRRDRREKDDVKVEPSVTEGNSAIARKDKEKSSGNDGEVAVETAPRQWRTRKRLFTKSSPSMQLRTKRVKRTLATECRRSPDKGEEDKHGEEKKDRVSARTSARHARAAKRTARVKCVNQLTWNSGKRVGRSAGSTGAVGAEQGRKMRWNSRSLSKDVTASSELDKDEGPEPRQLKGQKPHPGEKLASPEESDHGGVELDMETAEEVDLQIVTRQVEASTSVIVADCEQVGSGAEKEGYFQATDPDHDFEMATTSNDQSEAESEKRSNTSDCRSIEVQHVVCANTGCLGGEDTVNIPSDKAGDPASATQPCDSPGDVATTLSDSENFGSRGKGDGAEECEIDHKMQDETICQLPTSTDMEEPKHPLASEQPLTEAAGLPNEGDDEDAPAEIDQEEGLSESVREPPVPGLCDAGMRPSQQVNHFKDCLRKSIQFVDALLCNPPPGKICTRNCAKIRSGQCREGVACHDPLCRNWHQTKAHTDRCKNPLCEFGSRVELRGIMHQIANQDTEIHELWLEWKNKNEELVLATTNNSSRQYTEDELSKLNDVLDGLERRIEDVKQESEPLKNRRRILLANLSAIGVKADDDEADGFPGYDSHYGTTH